MSVKKKCVFSFWLVQACAGWVPLIQGPVLGEWQRAESYASSIIEVGQLCSRSLFLHKNIVLGPEQLRRRMDRLEHRPELAGLSSSFAKNLELSLLCTLHLKHLVRFDVVPSKTFDDTTCLRAVRRGCPTTSTRPSSWTRLLMNSISSRHTMRWRISGSVRSG